MSSESRKNTTHHSPLTTHHLYAFDAAWARGRDGPVAGADEAGRGALAGPIFAAAIVLSGEAVEGLNDSKVLRLEVRERLLPLVLSRCVAVSVVSFPAWWIDRHGVGRANREALRRAIEMVEERAGCLLADGNLKLGEHIECLPRADATSAAVAGASVVAKVLRDHAMEVLSAGHLGYGFERNRGYGTREHRLALAETGPCRVHRLTYAGVVR